LDEDGEVEDFIKNYDSLNCQSDNESTGTFNELDCEISEQEVIKAARKLKNDKASGMDNLINEYLKETIDIISAPITTLFNAVFNSGYFPTQWSKGVIIPVHKKGPSDDPNNYRGITLASSLGKLFTSVLHERLKHWSIANNIGTDAQYGFKPKYIQYNTHNIRPAIFDK
jgi:hypothetical protein